MRRSLSLLAVSVTCVIGSYAWGGPRPKRRPLPKEVDLRPDFRKYGLLPKDQGRRGVCSLFAITGLAEFEWANSNPQKPKRLSPEYLVWAANEVVGDSGESAMFFQATHALQTLGICSEAHMPYEGTWDPKRRPSMRAIADARTRNQWTVEWVKRYDVTSGLSEAQFRTMKEGLADKHPVAAGFRWPKHLRLSPQHVLETPPPRGVFDGHSVLLVGYRDDPTQPGGGLVVLRNSLGARWGDGGYALMTYAYVLAYANDVVGVRPGDPAARRPRAVRLEAECLRLIGADRRKTSPQAMTGWGKKLWSRGKQLFCRCGNGGAVELAFALRRGGRYRVDLLATCAPDYARVQVFLDGRRLGPVLDLYGSGVYPSGPLELGGAFLRRGTHRLRVTVVGKNKSSTGYAFGIDAIDLTRMK